MEKLGTVIPWGIKDFLLDTVVESLRIERFSLDGA